MMTRIYKLDELSEALEVLEADPPGWLQWVLFAILAGLLLAGSWAGNALSHHLGQEHRVQAGKGHKSA